MSKRRPSTEVEQELRDILGHDEKDNSDYDDSSYGAGELPPFPFDECPEEV